METNETAKIIEVHRIHCDHCNGLKIEGRNWHTLYLCIGHINDMNKGE